MIEPREWSWNRGSHTSHSRRECGRGRMGKREKRIMAKRERYESRTKLSWCPKAT